MSFNRERQEFKHTIERQARAFPSYVYLHAPEPLEPGSPAEAALTFDDGPEDHYTPAVLEILQHYRVPATFFLLGSQVEKYPGIAARMAKKGHAVGNHGYHHFDYREISAEELYFSQLIPTQRLLASTVGTAPRYFRPPYGRVTDAQVKLLGEQGYLLPMWTTDTFDWSPEVRSPRDIVYTVEQQHHPGAIILMHCARGDRSYTVEALPIIIEFLHHRGYRLSTIPDMLNVIPD